MAWQAHAAAEEKLDFAKKEHREAKEEEKEKAAECKIKAK